MDALGINLGYLLVQIFNFLIILVVLYAWVYKPILGLLDKRRNAIAKGLEDARVAAEARASAEEEAAKIISEAQAKAAQVVREATNRAEQSAREVRAAADAEIIKTREDALSEVQAERDRILGEVRGQVVALAVAAAQKIIGEALDEARQRTLINEFFSSVRKEKVLVLEGAVLSGPSAEVTSALPLTNEEMEVVKKDVLSKIGSQATITFRVNPDILGGLIIRAGGKVLDASIAGQLEKLRESLS